MDVVEEPFGTHGSSPYGLATLACVISFSQSHHYLSNTQARDGGEQEPGRLRQNPSGTEQVEIIIITSNKEG